MAAAAALFANPDTINAAAPVARQGINGVAIIVGILVAGFIVFVAIIAISASKKKKNASNKKGSSDKKGSTANKKGGTPTTGTQG